MSLLGRLRRAQRQGRSINVAVAGAGLIGRGVVRQIEVTPAMRTALIVNRTPERAVEAYAAAGITRRDIVLSETLSELQSAYSSRSSPATSPSSPSRTPTGTASSPTRG